jgi:tRNA pseudouridine38-40 synthase
MDETRPGTIWKLTLAYDGSPFAGWQVQPGRATIQGALQAALRRVTGELVLPQGSGRTDAGVHALAQVASCVLHTPIPAANLTRALNHALPPSIRVLATEKAAPGFHARHSAVSKTYEYRLWRAELCPPWMAPYVTPYDFPLSLPALEDAAGRVLGTHDFRSFQSHEPDLSARLAPRAGVAPDAAPEELSSSVRTLTCSYWTAPEPDLLVYRVAGTGFLHHMVRNLVGTFLAIGRGQIAPDAVPAMLAARSRSAAGPTAPASGLWLQSVDYPAQHLLASNEL